mmetsp:Transcript_28482/g.48406  ORF Transcript_28482/g.48406 Transcript_28482/m.48406 type:complete len:803 (-) Transcript_28482:1203-3611(-)
MATSPPPKKESIQNLQTECHYLSLALNRLNKKTADPEEYNFLKQKLQTAEEQLHAATSSAAEAVVDDYSYDENGPSSNTAAYDAYYAATNSYRQQLQAEARNYGDRKKGSKRLYKIDDDDDDDGGSSSGSSSEDSDDSSVGSAHRHVKRNYRKTVLKEKSRDILNKYHDKSKEYYHKGKDNYRKRKERYQEKKNIKDIDQSYWLKIILVATAFLMIVVSIAFRYRYQEYLGGSSSSNGDRTSSSLEPCAIMSITLKTDRFGNETSWDITQREVVVTSDDDDDDAVQYTESTIKSGGPYRYGKYTTINGYTEEINESICLPVGRYKFILHDKLGDGMCCEYGHGQYGFRIRGGREIRPMADGIFLGKEAITRFLITVDDVGVLGSGISSDSFTGEDDGISSSNGDGSDNEEDVTNIASTTTSSTTASSTIITTTTTTSSSVNDQSPPGVSTDGWSERPDDSDLGSWLDDVLLDDGLDGGMGDDNLLSGEEDDLISTLGIQSDDAVDQMMYQNIKEMDSNADGKVSHEEFATGSEEISHHCSAINVQTSLGRSECKRVCGEDHDCCFQPTQGGYDCKNDPSFACETYKACEILFQSNPADEFSAGFDGDGGSSSSRPTAQEMALIEESVHQFCSSGTVGIGMGKCQEICQDHLCCFETNFGVGNHCKSSYQGLCTYYAGCEQLAYDSYNWNSMNTSPNPSGLDMNNKPTPVTTVIGNQDVDEDFLPAVQPLTLEEKLEVQDQVDQACSQDTISSGNGQCRTLCQSHMCCFDASELGCADYDLMCPFYSSCEMLKFLNRRKRLRG